ncbi:MAG: hypothetical protein VZQ83_02515 [Eubacterium sp.]|nr:hypothetical protein [Eubacterium sp.]
MGWCPNCKNEYREGVTVCPDCEVELVDELPEETEESFAEPQPVVLMEAQDQEIGTKIVRFLRLNGIQSAVLTEDDEQRILVIVADLELEQSEAVFNGLIVGEAVDQDRLYELVPDIEDQFEEVENEQASKEFSELRSEASTVYVKKRDKYTDLRFSGFSFIGFGFIGVGIVVLNALGIINLFNLYSMIVMSLVFVVFFIIGFVTLHRAAQVKDSVAVEDAFTNELNEWIETNLGDDVIDEWYDESKEEQENYFEIQGNLCRMMHEAFPNIHPSYIEELAEERYTSYLERSGYEDPEDIPEVDEEALETDEDPVDDVFEEIDND